MFSNTDWRLETIEMRAPCACGGTKGIVQERNGQDVVRCIACGTHCYNRPKSESGKPQRSVRTRADIPPSAKARILERDNYTCVMCHTNRGILHIGHLLSVVDGRAQGFSEDELYDDENLAAMCEECNLGQGERTISMRLLVGVFRARVGRKAA